jgi:nondiscriminating aspartyl-tRNA synthetase
MERTLIKDLAQLVGKEVSVSGRILNMRVLSGKTFVVFQDYTGVVQAVFASEPALKIGEAAILSGVVKADARAKTGVELSEVKIVERYKLYEDIPFDISKNDLNLNVDTLFDQRTLSVRHPKIQAIFRLYDLLLAGYEQAMRANSFTEIKTPKLLETASEGGANFFKVSYYDKTAVLAQSPQFYKQIMVGALERVFEIGSVYRAEPSFTTRHVSEYIGLDAEMGFISSYKDVTAALTKAFKGMFGYIGEHGKEFMALYPKAEVPNVPDEIPHFKLAEIKEIIKKEYGHSVPEDTDIDPEGERLAGRYAKEKFGSDFVFITHYPWKYRAFYTMPSKENADETYGFDLFYKGLEVASGGQRIHDYDQLIENMKKKGVSPKGMDSYLNVFKFGMPPHGGWGLGSERLIQQLLGLESVKEAILFPRDVKRLNP